jgi:hypothetical protein
MGKKREEFRLSVVYGGLLKIYNFDTELVYRSAAFKIVYASTVISSTISAAVWFFLFTIDAPYPIGLV